MAGTFILGEQKVRPGAYFNIRKVGNNAVAGAINGVTAVIFKADFGPLNQITELSASDGYSKIFGTAGTTDAIREAIAGGAKTILAIRLGDGGAKSSTVLKDTDGETAVTIEPKYAGSKAFTVTVREKLTDPTLKECIIYAGESTFEKLTFAAGAGEAKALADAFTSASSFTARVAEGKDEAIIEAVSQQAFEGGADPTVNVEDYSNAFVEAETFEFNTICLDTEDTAVMLLLQSFLARIFDAGSFGMAVVAEKHTVDLDERIAHAVAFNDEKMHYVLNAYVEEQGTPIDGYQTAARIAGMIGAVECNSSLTHTVIPGFSKILDKLTNTQIIAAEKKGCIVLDYNKYKQTWIDYAINTLVTPADNQDDGWKKIRRVKTRFELMRRINETADALVGKVDNDINGRKTVVSALSDVGEAMVEEGKIISCEIVESSTYKADGDSAWFDIAVIDKDSMEHIYMTYIFQYSTNEE